MWARDGFTISTERAHLDRDVIFRYLNEEAYWSKGIPRELFDRSIDASLNFGLFEGEAGNGGKQVGYSRVVTDNATFAWLCDVFVLPAYRGRGLATWLIETVVAHPDLQAARLRARHPRRARPVREVRLGAGRGGPVHAHRAPVRRGRMTERRADAWKAPLPHNRRLGPRRRWWVYWTMADGSTGAALVDTETMADELVTALGSKPGPSGTPGKNGADAR